MSSTTPESLEAAGCAAKAVSAKQQIVRAGAGAGKTYALTHKVMDLALASLEERGRLPRLIVTTFTRKATQELRERLMRLALDEYPQLIEFVNSRAKLVVSTIHGVMDLFLKRYGTSIGLDPGYRVVSGDEAQRLARQIIRKLLAEQNLEAVFAAFPFNQLTEMMRLYAAHLAEHPETSGYDFVNIQKLFIKDARKVAGQLRSVADDIFVESSNVSWLEMAERFREAAKILDAAETADWQTLQLLLGEVLAPDKARYTTKNPPVSEATDASASEVLAKARKLLSEDYDPRQWRELAKYTLLCEELGQCFATEFTAGKRAQGIVEIADLEFLAMECVRNSADCAQAFRAEFDHWLVDEYQDTSPFQVALLDALAGDSPRYVVGDPQQSIYLFRGARAEVFDQKERQILATGGERLLLEINRRSRPELLLFINDLFSRFAKPFAKMQPLLKEQQTLDSTQVVAEFFVAAKTTELEVDSELDAIFAHVSRLLASGVLPQDICVLARANNTLAEVASFLMARGLPTFVHAASGYFDRREVRDAMALLKFLANQHDNFNLIELLRSPWFKVTDQTLCELTEARLPSLWRKLCDADLTNIEFEAVGRLQRLLEISSEKSLASGFRHGLIETGFIDLAQTHDVSGRREANIFKLLARLEDEQAQPGFNPLEFVRGSLADVNLEEGHSEGDAVAAIEPNRINLMTVHASKGLEFRHVVIPRIGKRPPNVATRDFTVDEENGRWSVKFPFGEDAVMTGGLPAKVWREEYSALERAESARVLYVAATRAIDSIFFSWTEPAASESWASMLRIDLSLGLHKRDGYSYRVYNEADAVPEKTSAAESDLQDVRSKWAIDKKGMAPRSLSVTSLIEKRIDSAGKSINQIDLAKRLTVATRGTLTHRLMELLKYTAPELWQKTIGRWFPGQEAEINRAIDFVKESENPPLLEIVASGEVEWGFSFIEGNVWIEGQVDLWGRDSAGVVWVVDYKTGDPVFREKAFAQMAIYATALMRSGLVTGSEQILLAAVYPFAEQIFVNPSWSEQQVRALIK